MSKLPIIAVTLVVAATGFAFPAAAALKPTPTSMSLGAPFCSGGDLSQAQVNDIAANLPGSDPELWNGCIREFVTDKSGHTHMAFYDPDSLKLVREL